jgi:histidine triad (HIT) family protein
MNDCIFCKVARDEVPAKIVYRDDDVVAIEDLNPQAPVHLLVMPRRHYDTIADVASDNATLAAALLNVAAKLGVRHAGQRGFRVVVNTGAEGGQTVGHVHVHVLAGRHMTWPPG